MFVSFINLLDTADLHINTCANCGKLFIPTSKSNEIYCDNPLVDDPSHTCKMVGADKKYKDKIKRIKALYQENFYDNYKLISDKIKTILYE